MNSASILKLLRFLLVAAAAALPACSGKRSPPPSPEEAPEVSIQVLPLAEPVPSSPAGTLFERLPPSRTGVEFENRIDTTHPLKRLYHSGFVCGGCAVGDVDGNGRPDLFFVSGPGRNRLYLQMGPLEFKDATELAAVDGNDRWGSGGAMADIDNDGDLDLYVCNYDAPNQLFLGDGKGRFTESAARSNLDLVDACLMPAFCDYDNDGDLDLYVLTNRYYREGGRPATTPVYDDPRTGKKLVKPEFQKYYQLRQTGPSAYEIDEVARPDYLLRNDGPDASGVIRFTDVSRVAGVTEHGYGLSATWWDYDGDGWTDIYIGNDFTDPDRLYRNNRDGTFTDVLPQTVNHTPWFSMGADVGDVNNDGRLDFFVLDMAATTHYKSKMSMGEMGKLRWTIERTVPRQIMRNALYVDTGTGRYLEAASLSGIAKSDWSWAAKLRDFDNDGRVDLFISNGAARDFNNSDIPFREELLIGRNIWDLYEETPPKREANVAFRNLGDFKFTDVSTAWGLDHSGMSYAAAHGDLDGDGDLDLVVVNLDEPVSIYENRSTSGHRAIVRLRGTTSNRYGIGARVSITTASGPQVRELIPASGYLSSNLQEIHFGLGSDEKIDELKVRWPSGALQRFEDLPVDSRFVITETARSPPPRPTARETSRPLFARSPSLRGLRHIERIYEDFVRQPLLPNKYSQLGPGMAWSDVDGDGDDDLFVGAARGTSGALLINDGPAPDGGTGFHMDSPAPFDQDADSEDMGVLFFDADSDGDEDLYIASGSYEYDVGAAQLRDRLYLNDGRGRFTKAEDGALPDFRDASGIACAADLDRDGDLDVFVGGRVVPGAYPLPASSRLLLNESSPRSVRFVEAPESIAPGLRASGLVTSALWSDADDDGWVDLLVTHEWGPVKLYRNERGTLIDVTTDSGLTDRLGWWNSIAGGDIDNDGDMDYAVGNVGLNTKYHATRERPILLYYGDYAGNGEMRIVEAEYEDDTLYPLRGKSCSSQAMPHLKEKFKTFHDFALAPLDRVYTPEALGGAHRFEANTLESGLLVNDGRARFTFRPLPSLVQIAPTFGVDFADVDADGRLDLYLAQNFFEPQFETGPFDGGLGLLLRGEGGGSLSPVWPRESGLSVPGDARSLTRVDFSADGHPDFVVTVNDGEVVTFENRPAAGSRRLNVRLIGRPGNLRAAGSRVTVELTDGSEQTAEVYAGGGYLSQSTATISFGLGTSSVRRITVRWPDGQASSRTVDTESPRGTMEIAHP